MTSTATVSSMSDRILSRRSLNFAVNMERWYTREGLYSSCRDCTHTSRIWATWKGGRERENLYWKLKKDQNQLQPCNYECVATQMNWRLTVPTNLVMKHPSYVLQELVREEQHTASQGVCSLYQIHTAGRCNVLLDMHTIVWCVHTYVCMYAHIQVCTQCSVSGEKEGNVQSTHLYSLIHVPSSLMQQTLTSSTTSRYRSEKTLATTALTWDSTPVSLAWDWRKRAALSIVGCWRSSATVSAVLYMASCQTLPDLQFYWPATQNELTTYIRTIIVHIVLWRVSVGDSWYTTQFSSLKSATTTHVRVSFVWYSSVLFAQGC